MTKVKFGFIFWSSHSQWAGPDLAGVLLSVIAGQAVSRGSTLAAAVAAAAAVTVGRGGNGLLQLRNRGIGYTVSLFTYKVKETFTNTSMLLDRKVFYADMPFSCFKKSYICWLRTQSKNWPLAACSLCCLTEGGGYRTSCSLQVHHMTTPSGNFWGGKMKPAQKWEKL